MELEMGSNKKDEGFAIVQGIKRLSSTALDAAEAGKFDEAEQVVSQIEQEGAKSESPYVKSATEQHIKLIRDQIEVEKKSREGSN